MEAVYNKKSLHFSMGYLIQGEFENRLIVKEQNYVTRQVIPTCLSKNKGLLQ